MTAKDVCVLFQEEETTGSFIFTNSRSRFVVVEMNAAGKLAYLHEGTWYVSRYRSTGGISEEYQQYLNANEKVVSGLIAAGWIRLGPKPRECYNDQHFYRDTTVETSSVQSIPDRLVFANGIMQSGKHSALAGELIGALEMLRDKKLEEDAVDPNAFVALLERLAKLHREGHLTDAEFMQAKLKAGLKP